MVDFEDAEMNQGEGIEPTPATLGHWLEEQYVGDDRFDTIEVEEPGPIEEEALRVKFICDDATHFFVAVLEEESVIRVGLATQERWVNDAIEAAANEMGDTLNEFLEIAMEAEDELEHEVQHFHDDAYYFCSDIPYQCMEDFGSNILRDEIIYYLEGYVNGLIDYLTDEED